MGKNISQIYTGNPSTTVNNNDLFYIGQSPYGLTNDSAIKYSDFFTELAGSFVQTTGAVTALHIPVYGANGQTIKDSGILTDVNQNIFPNNVISGYATTVTSGGSSTLTVASAQKQFFTGGSNQIVFLPVTSTLTLGHSFLIINNCSGTSTGYVTVQSTGGNTIQVMNPNTALLVVCISTSGSGASSWYSNYSSTTAQFQWNIGVTSDQTMVVNNGYQANKGAGTVNLTLPLGVLLGSIIEVTGGGSASSVPWKIVQQAGQSITYGSQQTTVGATGFLQSTNYGDSVKLISVTGSGVWNVLSSIGNLTVN